jgi:hypothetical protein
MYLSLNESRIKKMECVGCMAMLSERYYLPIKIIRGEKKVYYQATIT